MHRYRVLRARADPSGRRVPPRPLESRRCELAEGCDVGLDLCVGRSADSAAPVPPRSATRSLRATWHGVWRPGAPRLERRASTRRHRRSPRRARRSSRRDRRWTPHTSHRPGPRTTGSRALPHRRRSERRTRSTQVRRGPLRLPPGPCREPRCPSGAVLSGASTVGRIRRQAAMAGRERNTWTRMGTVHAEHSRSSRSGQGAFLSSRRRRPHQTRLSGPGDGVLPYLGAAPPSARGSARLICSSKSWTIRRAMPDYRDRGDIGTGADDAARRAWPRPTSPVRISGC
jgi:hypothetical protein